MLCASQWEVHPTSGSASSHTDWTGTGLELDLDLDLTWLGNVECSFCFFPRERERWNVYFMAPAGEKKRARSLHSIRNRRRGHSFYLRGCGKHPTGMCLHCTIIQIHTIMFMHRNIVQTRSSVLWDWECFVEYSSHFAWMGKIFCMIYFGFRRVLL